MIKFFRHIRRSLINQNQMGKYFKYAIGEILLVVIGILIALQINNWNQDRLDRKMELTYLKELKSSLIFDIDEVNAVLEFNIKKDSIVQGFMGIFDAQLTNAQRFEIIEQYSTPFTSYEIFVPNNTTWNNFIGSENINLIENKALRLQLMDYYNFDYEGSVQERLKVMNRKVIDENFPKFFTQEYTLKILNIDTNLPPASEFNMHLDQNLISDLFGIKYLINMQNMFLNERKVQILKLINQIDQAIQND